MHGRLDRQRQRRSNSWNPLREIWKNAGMEARKWVSNSKQVLAAIPEDKQASEFVIRDAEQPVVKTLGLSWFSEEDMLSVPAPRLSGSPTVTKRNVLKQIATIFDPLGLISPAIIKGKVLLQTMWSRGYDWYEEVYENLANEIQSSFEQLSGVAAVRIPCCIRLAVSVKSSKVITLCTQDLSISNPTQLRVGCWLRKVK